MKGLHRVRIQNTPVNNAVTMQMNSDHQLALTNNFCVVIGTGVRDSEAPYVLILSQCRVCCPDEPAQKKEIGVRADWIIIRHETLLFAIVTLLLRLLI